MTDEVRLFSNVGWSLQIDSKGYAVVDHFDGFKTVAELRRKGGSLQPLSRKFETVAYGDDFIRFAKLSTREDITKFADEFGYLRSGPMVNDEPIAYWETAISDMGQIIDFWQDGNEKRALELLNGRLTGESTWLEIDTVIRAFRVAPLRLSGLLYLQAANAVLGGRQYRKCVRCEELFSAARSTKKFCSMACKSAWHAANRKGN